MTVDLKNMSIKEMKKLQTELKKAIAAAETRALRDARKAAAQAAQEFGFTLEDLAGTPAAPQKKRGPKPGRKAGAKKKAGKAKYRNPADSNQTWTGKGRRPAWFISAVDAGTSASDLEI